MEARVSSESAQSQLRVSSETAQSQGGISSGVKKDQKEEEDIWLLPILNKDPGIFYRHFFFFKCIKPSMQLSLSEPNSFLHSHLYLN